MNKFSTQHPSYASLAMKPTTISMITAIVQNATSLAALLAKVLHNAPSVMNKMDIT